VEKERKEKLLPTPLTEEGRGVTIFIFTGDESFM